MILIFLEMFVTLVAAQHIDNIQDSNAGLVCRNLGKCVVNSTSRCMCPLGKTGQMCDRKVEIIHPQFDGTGFLALKPLTGLYDRFELNFTMTFRPESNEGLLLFSAQTVKADTDFYAVILKDGFVVFRFDSGSGLTQVRSTSRVNLGADNKVVIIRSQDYRKVIIKLNNERNVEESYQGNMDVAPSNLNLYVGGCHFMSLISKRIDTTHQFVGCIQELRILRLKVDFRKKRPRIPGYEYYMPGHSEFGLNVDECKYCSTCENNGTCTAVSANESVCVCPLGFNGATCAESQHAVRFRYLSYIEFPRLQSVTNFTDIEMFFLPKLMDGLLLYVGLDRRADGNFYSIALDDGHIEFSFDLGGGPVTLRSPEPLTYEKWHLVRATRSGRMGTLKVDDQTLVTGHSPDARYDQLIGLGRIYIGGHRNLSQTTSRAPHSFYGCIQKVRINQISFDLLNGASYINRISPADRCADNPGLNEESYRKLLYKLSGEFFGYYFNIYKNNTFYTQSWTSGIVILVYMWPVNTTLFPNKQTFYVVRIMTTSLIIDKYLMTLQYIKERLVQVERHYFPSTGVEYYNPATPLNTLSWNWSSFNTTRKNCGGYIYLINSDYLETVGIVNNCDDHNIHNQPEYYLKITCNELIVWNGRAGDYYQYTFNSIARHTFPNGWRVTPC